MKQTTLLFGIVLTLALLTAPLNRTLAADKEAGASASSFGQLLAFQPDTRVVQLKKFLQSYGSPMVGEAETFIAEADKNDLDWRLVAAIAGTESTFGRHIPRGSYNAWGWGIPTGARSGIGFDSWSDGIATVSRGLRKNYIDRGATTLESMGRIYAASPRWSTNVRFFLNKIDSFAPSDVALLDLSI